MFFETPKPALKIQDSLFCGFAWKELERQRIDNALKINYISPLNNAVYKLREKIIRQQ